MMPLTAMLTDLETVIQSEVSHTQKNKSFNTHLWNLEKWYGRTYLQSRKRDTDVGNKRMVNNVRKGKWNELGNED